MRMQLSPGFGVRLDRAALRSLVISLLAAALSACAPPSAVTVTSVPATARPSTGAARTGAREENGWRIETREHVDLWLHGFAMLQDDSSLVPYFRLGYRSELLKLRSAGGLLDTNRDRLQRRVAENPNLTSAQFLALYFASWDDLRRGSERFLRVDGNIDAAENQQEVRMFATLRTYFPAALDREWLRILVSSLDDERQRFFHSWWIQQQQSRASVRGSIESMWRGTYRAAFARFMNNSMQRDGAILLSLPLGGEGRTLAVGGRDNFVSVTLPKSGEDPREAIYVVAHEVVGNVATAAVRDNSSAADQRSGETGKWSTLAAVRGGAMLLERIAPDLVDGYLRYYLALARAAPAAGDLRARFNSTFPLPDAIRDALQRDIAAVLGGI